MLSNKFFRFCLVGGLNTAVDFTAFFLLHLLTVPYGLAQVISYLCGTVNSFFMNRTWTFQLQQRVQASEVIKFLVVNGVSLASSSLVLFLLYDHYGINLWGSKLVATALGIIINYAGSKAWVFTRKQQSV